MSVEYAYLLASLPTLVFGADPPLTTTQFAAACEGPLAPEHLADIRAIFAGRADEAQHSAARWFVARETQLRSALARARAQRAGADPQRFQRPFAGYDARTDEAVAQAMAAANPWERTMILERHRWRLLDQLVGAETFSGAAVFAYAFKLQILERLQGLSETAGLAAVDNIVNSNLAGLPL
jgi:hypothetical protein